MTRGLRTKLGALLDQADETHTKLAKVRDRKDALAAYIENAKLLDKAKEAAGQRWGNPQESDDFLREHVVQENIARDLRCIRLSLGGKPRGGGHAPVEEKDDAPPSEECAALLKEAAEFEDIFARRLHERLSGLVASAKRASEPAATTNEETGVTSAGPQRMELLALAHVSRALVTLGRTDAVEAVFAQVFVEATLQSATAACTSTVEESQRRGPAETGATNLGPFFDHARTALLSENSTLLSLAQRLRGSRDEFADGISMEMSTDDDADGSLDGSLLEVPGLCLVANSVVGPVLRHVQQTWPNIFMPAFPNSFAANYAHAASFTRAAEALMTPSERRNFATSNLLVDFQRRWKTQVYVSLRTKEAMQLLDTATNKSRASLAAVGTVVEQPPHVVNGRGFWLDTSAEAIRVLGLVWSDGWYMDAIYPKALQLSLDVIARYGQAIQSMFVVENNADPPHAGGWDAKSVPSTWAPSSWPVQISRACADVLAVQSSIRGEVDATGSATDTVSNLVLRRLPSQSGKACANCRAGEIVGTLLGEACDGLEPALRALEAGMLRQVVAAACKEFGAIRGIPAFYRMLNKPVPTKATAYVDSALRPIQALREVSAKVAPDVAVKGWLQHAVDRAAVEFSVQAAQLLESEASLKKRLGARGGGESQVSDLEKIHIQLCLDVEAFTAGAAALGTTASQAPGLTKLAEAVEPIRPTFEAHRTT